MEYSLKCGQGEEFEHMVLIFKGSGQSMVKINMKSGALNKIWEFQLCMFSFCSIYLEVRDLVRL